jgi:hypothetical protein
MIKKSILKITIFATALTLTVSGCEKEIVVPVSDIPSNISNYVKTHFPNNTIAKAIKDKDGFTKTYDILLSDGTSLEFNRKNEIVDIEGLNALPDSVIPAPILSYVKTNYATNYITDWEIDNNTQQVELNNSLELKFDKNGNFLRIDN